MWAAGWKRGDCHDTTLRQSSAAFFKKSWLAIKQKITWQKLNHLRSHWAWTSEVIWTPYSLSIFQNLKPEEISKNHNNTICTSPKVVTFCKIQKAWLKNWACHAHFGFWTYLPINLLILKLEPSPSGFKLLS